MAFVAPVDEILFTAVNMADLVPVLTATGADLDLATMEAVLNQAGRFAAAELAPLNQSGDRVGARLRNGAVETPPGWRQAYQRWTSAGWNAIAGPGRWGGQDMPMLALVAVHEIWNSANAAFALGPMLTASAVEMMAAHADPHLQDLYLPKLISGQYSASMDMTEAQAGSDIGEVTTRARAHRDGTYRIFGQKIFISYGDHDLSDNIVHFVLARRDGAGAGSRGLSLFLVPKFLPGAGDTPPAGNRVVAQRLEEKLGLHGSPTCAMVFGADGEGAIGWLIGKEGTGLASMFSMMNQARLLVGIQAIGVGGRACQQAIAYALERRQGRHPGSRSSVAIASHPDIQRTILGMVSRLSAARAICHACAAALDLGRAGPVEKRQFWNERAGLLTPVAKAFASDTATAIASDGIQVHGGAGYIEETGAAQHLRDARVFQIYEGTNGIQAIDLVTRKLPHNGGAAIGTLINDLENLVAVLKSTSNDDFVAIAGRLETALADLRGATDHILGALGQGARRSVLAVATPYLRLFALTLGGVLLAKGALAATGGDPNRWMGMAGFFADNDMIHSTALAATVKGGAAGLDEAAAAVMGHAASR